MKILVAEDELISRMILETTLEKLGHQPVSKEDGVKALQVFRREHFPVLIADWLMPNMDGIELAQKVRQRMREHYTYIIILTALGGKARYMEALYAGADDFVTKPFDEDELAARLHVAERIVGLREHVNRLERLLQVCSYCRRIREGGEEWVSLESYVGKRTETQFSHGVCPECREKFIIPQLEELTPGK